MSEIPTSAGVLPEILNVRHFGAKGDGSTDDYDAIQAALDAVPEDGGAVFMPRGVYALSRPLTITRSNTRLCGDGLRAGGTVLRSSTYFDGPMIVVGPIVDAAPPYAAPLAPRADGLPSRSVRLRGADTEWYLNLRESETLDLDGREALTIELFLRPSSFPEVGNLLSCCGARHRGDPLHTALELVLDLYGGLTARLDVSGTPRTVTTTDAQRCPLDQTRYVALVFTGTSLQLFTGAPGMPLLAGPVTTFPVGTIRQESLEDFTLGPQFTRPVEAARIRNPIDGQLDGLRISRVARALEGTLAPTLKHPADTETLFALDLDETPGMQVRARLGTVARDAWLTWRTTRYPSPLVVGVQLDGFMLETGSGGILMYGAVNSVLRNLSFLHCSYALHVANNSYSSRFDDLLILYTGRFGVVNGGASGTNVFTNLKIVGSTRGVPLLVEGSSVALYSAYITAASCGAMFLNHGGADMVVGLHGVLIADEAISGSPEHGLILEDVTQVAASGCIVEMLEHPVPAVRVNGDVSGVWSASVFNVRPDAPSVFSRGAAGTRGHRLHLIQPSVWEGSGSRVPPWSNDPHLLTLDTDGARTGTGGLSATTVAARNLRGAVTLKGDARSANVVFPTPEPDASYFLTLTPGTTGQTHTALHATWSEKSAAGFRVTLSAPPGAEPVQVDWILVR